MTIESLLSRMSKVRRRGNNKWMVSCPCHEDKHPSLSIKDQDGVILMHCFSQHCSAADICNAIGIDIQELFPPSDNFDASIPQRKQYHDAVNVLECLAVEALALHIIGNDMIKNGSIEHDERDRLAQASIRINAALEYIKRITN